MIALARNAMATRFEIVLHGTHEAGLRAAGEEALDELEKLESRLSLYRPGSEIAQVNALAGRQPVRVSTEVFQLLERALSLSEETAGAFDITVGPLMKCWGMMQDAGKVPSEAELAEARARVRWKLLHLDRETQSVRFEREGVMIDLGAIGKGYAIDRATELLRESGVTSGFLHGGTSTAYGIGSPPDAEDWKVALQRPKDVSSTLTGPRTSSSAVARLAADEDVRPPSEALAVIGLKDEALSVSAISGKYFRVDGQLLGHVIDPRTGQPVSEALMAAVVLPNATETDALSTSLLTLGVDGVGQLSRLRPNARSVVVNAAYSVSTHGI